MAIHIVERLSWILRCGQLNLKGKTIMKKCIVCGFPATGRCPSAFSHDGHNFLVCNKPLCDFCSHGHDTSNKTFRENVPNAITIKSLAEIWSKDKCTSEDRK